MESKTKACEHNKKRRDLLKAMGAGGVALALSGFAPTELFRPDGTVSAMGGAYQVPNVASLLKVPVSGLSRGDKFIVGGYYEDGDGGAKIVTWNPDSTKKDNGGTVHNPNSANTVKGRYEVLHDGTGDYRWFGILDETKAADEAFLAMVYDPSIVRIEARSNLLFKKRNRITRSGITLNFNGFKVFSYGIEKAGHEDPFGAVFFFTGELSGKQSDFAFTADLAEMSDIYEAADATKFTVGDWYTLICDANAGGREDKEIQKMCRVVEVVDKTHVRFDYKIGYPLRAGRVMSYQKVEPVSDVRIENMIFEGAGRPTTVAGGNASHPIAFEYATRCDVYNCHAKETFWAMIMRRFNTHYKTEKCSLYNPIEVQVGGTGYLTQQIYCLYGSVRDCHSSKTRHLNDFTSCAFMQVENCHNSGDSMGPFVTHGQYEHDLTYIGNSGLLSFAGSGATWGESTKRVTVKKHAGTRVVASAKVTDLTLEDIHVFYQTGATADAGTFMINADGIIMRGCSGEMLTLSSRCNRTGRINLIEGCTFRAREGSYFASRTNIIVQPVTFRNCNFLGVSGNFFSNTGPVTFDNCYFQGRSTEAKPTEFHSVDARFLNCEFVNTGIYLSGVNEQKLTLDGCKFTGSSTYPRIANYNTSNQVSLFFTDCEFEGDADAEFIFSQQGSRFKNIKITGTAMTGGKNIYREGMFDEGGFILIRDCVEKGHDRGALPSESNRVSYSGNIVL